MVSLRGIQNNKKKFLVTMVVIMMSATIFNYGLFGVMSGFFDTVGSIYTTVQMNIVSSIIVIGVVILIMFVLIPKESVNSIIIELEGSGGGAVNLTPEQELANMIEEELEENDKNNY